MGWLFSGSNRREDNHGRWEQADTKGAIRAKARAAQIRREDEARAAKARKKAEKQLAEHTRPGRRHGGWSW